MTGVTVQHPHSSAASAAGRARTPRRLVGLAGAVVLLFVLTGCLQLNVQMSVRKDDTVSGRILVAGDQVAESTDLDRLSPPSGLEQKVRITPYTADGFSGREIYFTQLTFAEVDTLAQAVDIEGARPYTMSFRRSGDTVAFTGSVDLSGVPEDRAESASTRVDLTFPNRITETNGSLGGGNSVSWTPAPGSITRMQASTDYPDPATRGFAVWMIVGIGAALLVSIGTVLAARTSRARSDRLVR
ncbi:LppM family (lipo)protein [Dietzia sp. 179-F 9C3 NHS]|uniref:LppM family (lipo)protein n=1 Tax=Dietzia sp. 179-F 9C3 NHS TaxID=3374295 RepID=UPI00387A6037